MRFLLSLVVIVFSGTVVGAADVWIFSGQSNMKSVGGAAQKAVGELVKQRGREYYPIYVAESGKPIEAWLEPKHRDYDKLWNKIEQQVQQAEEKGHPFRGFVWYQGESNASENAGRYQEQLTELVKRIRKLTRKPELPAIVVQIGSATAYSGKDWAAATIREAQRRFAREDEHAAVVTAIDAEIRDLTVHLSKAGAEVVSARIAAAADRLAYGNPDAKWGPQFKEAYFADQKHRLVVVEFEDVQETLKLTDGWLAGFGVSVRTTLPPTLSRVMDATKLGQLPEDYLYPVGGSQLDRNRLILAFDRPLPSDARLSYAASRNAQYGPHRRWRLEFGGLQDGSGHQTPAFVLVPIGKAQSIEVPSISQTHPLRADWEQIAINCVGRFPNAVTARKTEAGLEVDGWRQSYWNPASLGLAPNLFDSKGNVTPISFHTGVWYMSPYFLELNNGDDALMASWCKNSLHGIHGLKPKQTYDLAIYLLQGPPKKSEAKPSHRPVRVSVLDVPDGKKRNANTIAQQIVQVPADGKFDGYQLATKDNEFRGNVLILNSVPANDVGQIDLAIEIGERKMDSLRWSDTTLAGVQIRRSSKD